MDDANLLSLTLCDRVKCFINPVINNPDLHCVVVIRFAVELPLGREDDHSLN